MNSQSTDNVVIRKMRKEDQDAILAVTRNAWSGNMIEELLEERHGALWEKNAIERKVACVEEFCQSEGDKVIVVQIDGKVVGYATFMIYMPERIGSVDNNAVDTEYQGRGIGTVMNKWIIDHFREKNLKIARVCTMKRDVPAQHVYEKNGFKELARTIHYSMEL